MTGFNLEETGCMIIHKDNQKGEFLSLWIIHVY